MERKTTNRQVLLREVREVEMSRDWFNLEASLLLISTSLRCWLQRSPSLWPVSPMFFFLRKLKENTREMISDSNSSLRSRNFVRVGDERTGPHPTRAHLNVPG